MSQAEAPRVIEVCRKAVEHASAMGESAFKGDTDPKAVLDIYLNCDAESHLSEFPFGKYPFDRPEDRATMDLDEFLASFDPQVAPPTSPSD
jgi:hypothetical protein